MTFKLITRQSQVSSARFDYVCPPNSVGHNFFVRTPFRVFLDSMENSLKTLLKTCVLHQVFRLFGCVDVNSQVLTLPLHGML